MATEADFKRLGRWAVMLNPDANIDRHHSHRTVPMEVLSLGISRTGTLSMQDAYRILGYPNPYHYSSIFANILDADYWTELLRAKYDRGAYVDKAAFDQLLGDSGAVTDTPCVVFWKELIDAYPEAKIVLVERDVEKWLTSCRVLLKGVLNPIGVHILRHTDPAWYGRINNCALLWVKGFFGSTDLEAAMGNARAAYEEHYAAIRAYVPQEKILEYRLGSGWKPLCDFLGKDVPDVPFPRHNETKTIQVVFGVAIGRAFKRSLVNIGVVVGSVAVAGGLAWRYFS